ncbi:MAG: hypothetical protein KatS3mg013_1322 [Actinomycetota bacterium]|jgi:hypothetical protein|nr:MAG: hypothetical protein KatS3mg013_1322 [Actinomycetota bacterium]
MRKDARRPPEGYAPGVCNIGPAEIARRRRIGHLGVAASVALLAALAVGGADRAWRTLVVAPASVAAAGYLQARLRFCANYGFRGLVNMGPIGAATRIEAAEAIARDRRRALAVGAASLAVGIAVALVAVAV